MPPRLSPLQPQPLLGHLAHRLEVGVRSPALDAILVNLAAEGGLGLKSFEIMLRTKQHQAIAVQPAGERDRLECQDVVGNQERIALPARLPPGCRPSQAA